MRLAFFDIETMSATPIEHGVWRYAADKKARVLVMSLIVLEGGETVFSGWWIPEDFRGDLAVDDQVPEQWNREVENGTFVVAHNAQFERVFLTLAGHKDGLKPPKLEKTLCTQAMVENYACPGGLGKAAKVLGVATQKDTRGKALIKKFCDANKPWPTKESLPPKKWLAWQLNLKAFGEYCLNDSATTIDVFRAARPWTAQEWHDYHVVERINDRGVPVDVELAEGAFVWAAAETAAVNRALVKLSGDPQMGLTKSKNKLDWVFERVAGTDFEKHIWRKKFKKITDEDGNQRKVAHKTRSLDGAARQAIYDHVDELSERGEPIPAFMNEVLDFLHLLDRGSGVATKKFKKIAETHYKGRIRHAFRCSPTNTGRGASRGVQLDNVIRAKLRGPCKKGTIGHQEHPAIDATEAIMLEGAFAGVPRRVLQKRLEAWYQLPISDILARLIRPSIIAPDGWWLVWGDWSAVEARELPWLAEAEHALRPYRAGECVYCQAAENIFGIPWKTIYDGYVNGDADMTYKRLIGKVATLSLGFQGGARALRSMALNYGIKLTLEQCEAIKQAWRKANLWAVEFWDALKRAAWGAMRNPGTRIKCRKVTFQKIGADLFCFLPDGRPILYPQARIEKKQKEWEGRKYQTEVISYRKMYQKFPIRGELYGGIICENITQGVEASLLRDLLRRLDARGMHIIGSTHDEVRILSQDPARDAAILEEEMLFVPEWQKGLPLKAEIETGAYYGK